MNQDGVYTNRDGEDRQPLLFNAVTNSLQRPNSDTASENQTSYCWRWYILAVVAVLNLSNGMVSLVVWCHASFCVDWSEQTKCIKLYKKLSYHECVAAVVHQWQCLSAAQMYKSCSWISLHVVWSVFFVLHAFQMLPLAVFTTVVTLLWLHCGNWY